MAAKKALGKGLGNLIPVDTTTKSEEKTKIVEKLVEKKVVVKEPTEVKIKINEIEPNKDQPRSKFDEDQLEELAESIRQFGIIEPLIVQKRQGYYELIAGERRWRAAKKAGLKEVPVVIREYSDREIMEVALIENVQRQDLNPIEEAKAYQRLIKEFNLKQDEVADRVSKSRATITNSMRLLKLDERVQQMLIDEMISTGHARTLLAIENGDDQYTVAMRIFDEKLSVRDIEKIIKELAKGKSEKGKKVLPTNDFIYRDYEERLKTALGSKVIIHNKENNKGKIEIDFTSRQDFERIIDLIAHIK